MTPQLPSSLMRTALIAGCAALLIACNDPQCPLGLAQLCTEHSGPLTIRYCQADGTMSDCVPQVDCNPLDQTGCEDGLACYAGDASYGTLCAPAETLPCPPGQEIAWGIDDLECQPHCVVSEEGLDPVRCDEGEICGFQSELPDGVGTCLVIHAD